MQMCVVLTEQTIDVESVQQKVTHRNAGAIVLFLGTVREMTGDKKTCYLKYEAYSSMALKKMQQIVDEIELKWPNTRTAITHRIGELQISELAVVIAVSSPHRKDAYVANEYAIERIKEIVPIWKKEHWEDGTEWIGNQRQTVAGEPL